MHYHLYKDPNKAPSRLSVMFPAIDDFMEDLGLINWNKLDKVTASLLMVATITYSLWNSTIGLDTEDISDNATVAAYNRGSDELAAEKALKMDFASAYEEAEARNNFYNDENLLTEDEQQDRSDMLERLSQVKDSISKLLEEKSKSGPSTRKVTVAKGDTLVGLLVNKANVSRADAFEAVNALKKYYNPSDILPGNEITVFFHRNPGLDDIEFKGIQVDKDIMSTIMINRDSSGSYNAKETTKEVVRSVNAYKGQINSSLYLDASRAGIPDYVIAELIRMYSWNVDFQRDIRNGDKFEVLYEEFKTADGKILTNKGKVIYAKLALHNEELPFYRYEDRDGFLDYYDEKGQSARKALMKTPINGARLSSGFGMRVHPVMGFSKMHKGLDFAAPRGTPIYASGDGIVEKAERFSSYGNYVKIRHRNGLKTAYAHMNGFFKGLRKGQKVKQGDVIGYVGNTGRSTGPHLHYEVVMDGVQVNPASINLPTGIKLRGKDLEQYKKALASARANFKKLADSIEIAEGGGNSMKLDLVTAKN